MKKLLLSAVCTATLIFTGCTSVGHGNAGGGCTYGSGPNCTKPMPQTTKVNIAGIGGAVPVYETQASGGCNKDYTVLGKNYQVWRGATSYIEEGTASWYGPGFHGKKTSNGEIYNQKGYTAAHKNLPLPSYVKVTNLTNGKKIIVRVNDRGPFVESRIIDLSEGSAQALNMVGSGTAKVRIELIKVMPGGTYANATGKPSGSSIVSAKDRVLDAVANQGYTSKLKDFKTKADAVSALRSKLSSAATYSASDGYSTAVAGQTYIQLVACNSDKMAQEIRDNIKAKYPYPVIIHRQGNINRVLVGPMSEAKARQAMSVLKNRGFTDSFIKKF
ncbi:MAG: septal ring lytic transglycosylase RlpA family protein [Succinivibrio sp.]